MIKPAQQSARPSEDERIRTSASRFWRPTDTTGAHPQARHPTRGDDVLPGNLGLTARCRIWIRHGQPARRPGLLRAREHPDVGTAQVGRVDTGERHGRRVTGRLEGRKRFHFVVYVGAQCAPGLRFAGAAFCRIDGDARLGHGMWPQGRLVHGGHVGRTGTVRAFLRRPFAV